MARHVRIEYPGAIYHVTVRMLGDVNDSGTVLFRDDADRERFLDRLEARVEEYEVRLYAYCLMRNHFHLVVETPRANLGAFMGSLNTAYASYYNLRHGRRGHLMQGRYGARLVEGDAYLLSLSRYVHLNPVHVKAWTERSLGERLEYLRTYRWSSYMGYAGRSKQATYVNEGPVLAACGKTKRAARSAYRDFVEGSLAEEDGALLRAMKGSALGIGDPAFLDGVKERYIDVMAAHKRRDDVSLRHVVMPLEPERVLGVAADILRISVSAFKERRRNSPLRGIAGGLLTRYADLTQREAAAVLGVGCGSSLARQTAKVRDQRARDRGLQKQLQTIESELDALRGQSDGS